MNRKQRKSRAKLLKMNAKLRRVVSALSDKIAKSAAEVSGIKRNLEERAK